MQNDYRDTRLIKPVTGPLQLLKEYLKERHTAIEEWFAGQWQLYAPPVYGSVDLRNAGFKLTPVDMNLFPAGFNNLVKNQQFVVKAAKAAYQVINQYQPGARRLLILPENHTRNLFYWESVGALCQILKQAGFDVRIGFLSAEVKEAFQIKLASNEILTVEPLLRNADLLTVKNFTPDVILLNNDLSEGIPAILQNLAQPLLPPPALGWSLRLKSQHFTHYAEIVQEFSDMLKLDPWTLAPLFRHAGQIDFMHHAGEDRLSLHVAELLEAIRKKYDEYQIPAEPYVVIKADAGTYGMAVMMVKNEKEIVSLNRKQRTHMSKSKGGRVVEQVIIQEGVPTIERWGEEQSVAESVIYLWGQHAVGGFYRVHPGRKMDENLNSPGMHFEPCTELDQCYYTYEVVARLSMLAAARELKQATSSLS